MPRSRSETSSRHLAWSFRSGPCRPKLAVARLAPLLALSLIGGCRKAPESEHAGAPSDSVAGTEAERDPHSRTHRSHDPRSSSAPSLARSLTAVATTDASDAPPCERVCGRLGDCLLADPDFTSASASALELACLDLCVHSADAAPAQAEFLACGQQSECGQLQACAERSWTALAQVRQGPDIAGVLASADPCRVGCRWTYACIQTGMPPGQAPLDPHVEQWLELCEDNCERNSYEREWYTKMANCLPTRCSPDRFGECFSDF